MSSSVSPTSQPRDEFSYKVKEALGKRVGLHCSICFTPTSGPHEDPSKVTNIGVAAHISAAAPGGPRYNGLLTSTERKSIQNAIWLCQNCAKLIDNDPTRFGEAELLKRKRDAELKAKHAVGQQSGTAPNVTDVDIIRFFVGCFDRPAFQDPIHQERSLADFDKAMEDTLTALSTGCLRARDGAVLTAFYGKGFLQNADWRSKMDTISQLIRAIRARFREGLRSGAIESTEYWGSIKDRELARWFDASRGQVMEMFSDVCDKAGVSPPYFGGRW